MEQMSGHRPPPPPSSGPSCVCAVLPTLSGMESRVIRRSFAAGIAALVLPSALAAQVTLDVGPGGYAQIADAVAVAQPGDLIVVANGSYLPFHLPIGVTIVAPDGATVTTPPGGGGLPWVHDYDPPAGQQATIVGLSYVTNPAYPPAEPPVSVRASGNVVFADCVFHNWSDFSSHAVICDGDVQFTRCQWNSCWDGLSVTGGRVIADQCKFRAYRVNWAGAASRCIVAGSGVVRLELCDLRGSDADGQISMIGSPAIDVGTFATLSIADSTVYGGNSMTWASVAIDNNSLQPVRYARSTILGGTGTLSWYPPLSGPGAGFDGAAQEVWLVGGGGIPAGPRIGSQYYGSVFAPANRIVAMVLSFERTAAITVPFALEPVHFDPMTALAWSFGLPNQQTGWLGIGAYVWQTPTLGQALLGQQFWLHGLVWNGAAFEVGPSCGGVVR